MSEVDLPPPLRLKTGSTFVHDTLGRGRVLHNCVLMDSGLIFKPEEFLLKEEHMKHIRSLQSVSWKNTNEELRVGDFVVFKQSEGIQGMIRRLTAKRSEENDEIVYNAIVSPIDTRAIERRYLNGTFLMRSGDDYEAQPEDIECPVAELSRAPSTVFQEHVTSLRRVVVQAIATNIFDGLDRVEEIEETLTRLHCGVFVDGCHHTFADTGEFVPSIVYENRVVMAEDGFEFSGGASPHVEEIPFTPANERFTSVSKCCLQSCSTAEPTLESKHLNPDILYLLMYRYLTTPSLEKMALLNRNFHRTVHECMIPKGTTPQLALSRDTRLLLRTHRGDNPLIRIRGHNGIDQNGDFGSVVRFDEILCPGRKGSSRVRVTVRAVDVPRTTTRTTGVGLVDRSIASVLGPAPEISYTKVSKRNGAWFFSDSYVSIHGTLKKNPESGWGTGDVVEVIMQDTRVTMYLNQRVCYDNELTLELGREYCVGFMLAGRDTIEVEWKKFE